MWGALAGLVEPWSWSFFSDPTRLREWVASWGAWGPVVSVGLSALQVIVAPIPGQSIAVANAYVYGFALGLTYTMLGLVLGSGVAMWLARKFGRPLVERFVPREKIERWDELSHARGETFFLLVFLVPFLPDDLVCFVIGLTALPIGRMLVISFFGRLPGMLAACLIGANAASLPWWAWMVIVGLFVLLGWLFVRNAERLEAGALGVVRRAEGWWKGRCSRAR